VSDVILIGSARATSGTVALIDSCSTRDSSMGSDSPDVMSESGTILPGRMDEIARLIKCDSRVGEGC